MLALAITAMRTICRFTARSREVGDAPGNKLGMMSWSVQVGQILGRMDLFIDKYLFSDHRWHVNEISS